MMAQRKPPPPSLATVGAFSNGGAGGGDGGTEQQQQGRGGARSVTPTRTGSNKPKAPPLRTLRNAGQSVRAAVRMGSPGRNKPSPPALPIGGGGSGSSGGSPYSQLPAPGRSAPEPLPQQPSIEQLRSLLIRHFSTHTELSEEERHE